MIKTYDTMASSGYIRFSHSPVAVTRELSSEVVCDFDANNKLIGVEFIDCIPSDFESLEVLAGASH